MIRTKKNLQIDLAWHRSSIKGFINILVDLIAYCHHPKKPLLSLVFPGTSLLAA